MSFVAELKRRKVLRVAAVYASAVFAVIEGVDVLIASLGVPAGALRLVTLLGIAGFPIALGLAWTFDVGRGGVRTTAGADTPEGRAELEAAAGLSLLDGRTMLLAGALVVFGLGLGTGIFLTPAPSPAVDDGPSIAVLPFENRSSDADAVFFVDGIHDEVLNQLSRIRALRVISRASVMAYRDDPKPIRQVGEELGVQTVVAGGVQRAGDAVRISVQLIDARNDAHYAGIRDPYMLCLAGALDSGLAKWLWEYAGASESPMCIVWGNGVTPVPPEAAGVPLAQHFGLGVRRDRIKGCALIEKIVVGCAVHTTG